MSINDPLGDMLARIRNAQMRYKAKVTTPASKLREHVLDVLAEEGYIRGYARVDYSGGRSEFEIELKYFDGEPVIKDIKRVSTPGRRVYSSVRDLPTVANGLGVAILSTPKGVMSDPARAPRMSAAKFSVAYSKRSTIRTKVDHVAYRQKTSGNSRRRHRRGERPGGQGEGSQGRAQARAGRRHHRQARQGRDRGHDARGHQARRAPCGACRGRWSPTSSPG